MADLPVRFKERMKELLGEGYEAFEASYDKERVQGLRLNSLKTGRRKAPMHWPGWWKGRQDSALRRFPG